MAIDTPDPHEAMKRELVNRTRRLQEQHVEQQLNAQRVADRAASDRAREQLERGNGGGDHHGR
jgi:hypothetical protein